MAFIDRSLIRKRRSELSADARDDAAAAVAAHANSLAELVAARHVAAYHAYRGELDPAPIIHAAWARGASVYLPVTSEFARPLEFAAYDPDVPLETGRYGIPTPGERAARRSPLDMDVVLVPLVAFDENLIRIGAGAGHYDRTFAPRLQAPPPPLLIGLAYHWQQVAPIEAEVWDVPLDLVVTDHEVVRPPNRLQ